MPDIPKLVNSNEVAWKCPTPVADLPTVSLSSIPLIVGDAGGRAEIETALNQIIAKQNAILAALRTAELIPF